MNEIPITTTPPGTYTRRRRNQAERTLVAMRAVIDHELSRVRAGQDIEAHDVSGTLSRLADRLAIVTGDLP